MKEIGQEKYQQSHQEATHRGKKSKISLGLWNTTDLAHDLSEGVSYYCFILSLHFTTPAFFSFPLPMGSFPSDAVVLSLFPFRSLIRCHLPSETTLNTQHISTPNIHYLDCPALFLLFFFWGGGAACSLYPLEFKFAEERDTQGKNSWHIICAQ